MDSVIAAIGAPQLSGLFLYYFGNNGSKIQGNRRCPVSIMAISLTSINGKQTDVHLPCSPWRGKRFVSTYQQSTFKDLSALAIDERAGKGAQSKGPGLSGNRCAWPTSGAAAGQHPLTGPVIPRAAAMWIQVRTMDGSQTHRVDNLSKLTKVDELRLKIQELFKVEPERQRLFYRGKQVRWGHTAGDVVNS